MIRPISAQELKTLLDGGGADPQLPGGRIHLYDVRGAEAFGAGHVPGAAQVPHHHVVRWIPQQAHTQSTVVLIDDDGRPGGPAREVAAELAHHWFRNLRYLVGGVAAWREAGLALEQGGPTGSGAASHDGMTREYQTSKPVPWQAPSAEWKPPKAL